MHPHTLPRSNSAHGFFELMGPEVRTMVRATPSHPDGAPPLDLLIFVSPEYALSYVSALRVYLESFRPVGEAQVIDRYIDKWCTHYLRTTEHANKSMRELFGDDKVSKPV